MNSRLGSTLSPISIEKISSAAEADSVKERKMTVARNRWIAAAALVLLLPACAKKKPQTPSDLDASTVTTTTSPTTDVAPRTQGDPVDKTQDPLAGDLAQVNDYVWKNGLLGDVYFEFDKADLIEEARARLARNAEWLRDRCGLTCTTDIDGAASALGVLPPD